MAVRSLHNLRPAPPSLSRVYLEELRAVPRARFALWGAAAVGVLVALLAAVNGMTSNNGLWGFALFVHLVVPVGFAAFAAANVAAARSTKFVQPLFTTPLRKSTYLAAKVLVSLTVGGLYLLATLPFYAVVHTHVGLSAYMWDFLLIDAGIILFAVALGTFLGVSFTGRSIGAPTSAALGFMIVCVFAGMYSASLLDEPAETAGTAQRIAHFSPIVLLSDATDLYRDSMGRSAEDPTRSLALYAVETLGLLALAFRVFLRHQGIEGWESGAARRTLIMGAAIALLAMPPVAADVDYLDADVPQASRVFPTRSTNATIGLVPPGAPATIASFGPLAGTASAPLEVAAPNKRDLLVALDLPLDALVWNVTVAIEGDRGLRIATGALTRLDGPMMPERAVVRDPLEGDWEAAVIRVPLELVPENATELSMNVYGLRVDVEYAVGGESRAGSASTPVRADVPQAGAKLALAGSPVPLIAAAAAIRRRSRHG